jgi:hypothetical protein
MNKLPLLFFPLVIVFVCAIGATILPLSTYTFGLAAFGLPHVLAEFKYVTSRFQTSFRRQSWENIAFLLAAIVGIRVLQLFGQMPRNWGISLELLAVVGLIFLVIPELFKSNDVWGYVGITLAIIFTVGIIVSPATTLVVLAIAHNLTPVGFIAERLRGRERTLGLALCIILFLAIPLAIASGVIGHYLGSFIVMPELSLFNANNLTQYLHVYVPAGIKGDLSRQIFSAAVFLQCMHYLVVLGLFPHWEGKDRFIDHRWFIWGAIAATSVLFIGFCHSFSDGRSIYGLVAAVHAWIEIPVLLQAAAVPKVSAN